MKITHRLARAALAGLVAAVAGLAVAPPALANDTGRMHRIGPMSTVHVGQLTGPVVRRAGRAAKLR